MLSDQFGITGAEPCFYFCEENQLDRKFEIEKARRTDRGQPSERVPDLLRYLLAIAIHMVDPRNSDLFTTPVSGKLTSVFNTNLADSRF
jgi:hypothetical protein